MQICPETQTELTGEDLSLRKQTFKVWKRSPITQMCSYQYKESRMTKKKSGNITPPKKTNRAPITDPK